MRMVLTGLLAALSLAWLLTVGCASLTKSEVDPPLSMFLDVPLPQELAIDEKNSQVYEHSIGRVGLMRASGGLAKSAVLDFYRTGMVQNGWSKDSEFDNGEQQVLVFSKSPRSAAVTVVEGWYSTSVEINVSSPK